MGARALSQCAAIIFPHEWAAVSVVPSSVLRGAPAVFSTLHPPPSDLSIRRSPSLAALLWIRSRERAILLDASISSLIRRRSFQDDSKGRYVSSLIVPAATYYSRKLITHFNRCKKEKKGSFIFIFVLNFCRLGESVF